MKMFSMIACVIVGFNVLGQTDSSYYLEGYTQGTTFHIHYVDGKNIELKEELIQLLIDFENSLSSYDDNSLLSKLNRNETNKVDSYFVRCFKYSKKVSRITMGAFDPTILPLLSYYGQGPKGKEMDHIGNLDSIRALVGMDKVKLRGHKLIKKNPGIQLDFNACAQGYSVDLVGKLFESHGINNYLIEIGGEVLGKGKDQKGQIWNVHIEEPDTPELYDWIYLKDQAIATSGNYRKWKESGGELVGHEVDPVQRKMASTNILSATVIASSTIKADAYATAFCIVDLNEIKRIAKREALKVKIVYLDDNEERKVYESDGFQPKPMSIE